MELREAKNIVGTLAQGIDPITGEVFGPDSPYNHPRLIRALFTVHAHAPINRSKMSLDERRRENIELGRPKNAGLPWTDEDRTRVASGFGDGSTFEELAAVFERSRAAIQAELARQGLVQPMVGSR